MVDREFYMEVMEFLTSCGGAYERLKDYQCQRILECLHHGCSLHTRDSAGKISQFVAYWRISEQDIEKAIRFERPVNPFDGDVFFSVDFASREGAKGAMKLARELVPEKETMVKAGCFEHKGRFVICDRTNDQNRPWKLRR